MTSLPVVHKIKHSPRICRKVDLVQRAPAKREFCRSGSSVQIMVSYCASKELVRRSHYGKAPAHLMESFAGHGRQKIPGGQSLHSLRFFHSAVALNERLLGLVFRREISMASTHSVPRGLIPRSPRHASA